MKRITMVHGLVLGMGLSAYGLLYRLAHLDEVPGLSWMFFILGPAMVWLGLRGYRLRSGSLRYGRGVALSALIGALGSFVYAVYVYVFNRFVDDSLLRDSLRQARHRLTERGLSGEALEQQMRGAELLLQPGPFAVFVFLELAGVAVVAGLVLAAVLKRPATAACP